jgi:hypothetical protein
MALVAKDILIVGIITAILKTYANCKSTLMALIAREEVIVRVLYAIAMANVDTLQMENARVTAGLEAMDRRAMTIMTAVLMPVKMAIATVIWPMDCGAGTSMIAVVDIVTVVIVMVVVPALEKPAGRVRLERIVD